MPIAVYKNKVFEVNSNKVNTFDDLQLKFGLQTEKQDADNSKPKTYIKGSDLGSISLRIKLDSSLGVSPRREMEDWESIMDAKEPYQFILGGKPIGKYKWLLIGVEPSNLVIDNLGSIASMELALQFDEYVSAGSAKESGSKKKKSAPGISSKDYSKLEASVLGQQNKTSLKRRNSNMQTGLTM